MTVIKISSGLIVGGIILGTISFSALVSTAPLEKIVKGAEENTSSMALGGENHIGPDTLSSDIGSKVSVQTSKTGHLADVYESDDDMDWGPLEKSESVDTQNIPSVETFLNMDVEPTEDGSKESNIGEDLKTKNSDSNPVDGFHSIRGDPNFIVHTPEWGNFGDVAASLQLDTETRQKSLQKISRIESPRWKGEGLPCDGNSGLPPACVRKVGVLGERGSGEAKKDLTYRLQKEDSFSLDKKGDIGSIHGQGSINENMIPSYMTSKDVNISLNRLIGALLKHYMFKMIPLQKISKATGRRFLKFRSWINSVWDVMTSFIEKGKKWTYRKTSRAKVWSDDALHLRKTPSAPDQMSSSMDAEKI